MVALIGSLLGIAAVLLEAYMQRRPQREKEDADEKTQSGRNDLVAGNVDAVVLRVDSLLTDSGCSTTRVESAEDIERRIGQL